MRLPSKIIIIGVLFVLGALSCKESSNEVLDAFNTINHKLEHANRQVLINNDSIIEVIRSKDDLVVNEKLEHFIRASKKLDLFLQETKNHFLDQVAAPSDYKSMDDTSIVDSYFFQQGELTPKATQFLNEINNYQVAVTEMYQENYPEIVNSVQSNFNTHDVIHRNGEPINWLSYQFEGFPLIASITKITAMQNDIKSAENTLLLLLAAQ